MDHNCAYVRLHYQVPAEIGRRVIAYGKPGVILADRGHYIGVVLDEDRRSGSPTTIRRMKCSTARWRKRYRSKSGWSCRLSMTGTISTGTARPAKIWSGCGQQLAARPNTRLTSGFRITATVSRRCCISKSVAPEPPSPIALQSRCLSVRKPVAHHCISHMEKAASIIY